jgi:DNA-binding phage protein
MSEERKVSTFWQEIASGSRELPRPAPVERGAWKAPFLAEVARCRTLKDAAEQLGVTGATMYRALARDPDFRHQVDLAWSGNQAARELVEALAGEIARRR